MGPAPPFNLMVSRSNHQIAGPEHVAVRRRRFSASC